MHHRHLLQIHNERTLHCRLAVYHETAVLDFDLPGAVENIPTRRFLRCEGNVNAIPVRPGYCRRGVTHRRFRLETQVIQRHSPTLGEKQSHYDGASGIEMRSQDIRLFHWTVGSKELLRLAIY